MAMTTVLSNENSMAKPMRWALPSLYATITVLLLGNIGATLLLGIDTNHSVAKPTKRVQQDDQRRHGAHTVRTLRLRISRRPLATVALRELRASTTCRPSSA